MLMGVSITHPDKVVWPDAGDGRPVTKLDLARYFEAMAGWIMPHIRGRPCSILRAPDGVPGPVFFQRHAGSHASPHFEEVRLDNEHAPYLVFNRPQALIDCAQIGAIELHPTGCAPDRPDTPGRLVFDFDPDDGAPLEAVIEAAQDVRSRLEAIGLAPFCRTTGGKGLHVVVPLRTENLGWDEAKGLSRRVCEQMVADRPDLYVAKTAKALRKGKIFLDYLRNDRLSTAIALLSPRARLGATVAMPLDWNEVRPGLDPKAFTVRTAPALVERRNPWRDYENAGGSLASARDRLK